MTELEALADIVEAEIFADNHKDLCGCENWPDNCKYYPKGTPFSVNTFTVIEAAAPHIVKAVREQVAQEIDRMPISLGDEGWKTLADKAEEAGYLRRLVDDRRRRDDFTTDTIESAYQYGYRQALKIARGGGL